MLRKESETKCEEQWSNVAIGVIFIGVSVVAICFMWPMPLYYSVDPTISATDNERKDMELHNKQVLLYSLTCVGMALVTIGGLITAGLFTRAIVVEECIRKKEAYEAAEYKPSKASTSSSKPQDETKLVDETDSLSPAGASASAGSSYGAVGGGGTEAVK